MLLFLIFTAVVFLFGFVLIFGAPYLPTFRRETEAALDLLDLKRGQTLYELGCGDGRVLKAAARRGLRGVGYELNPLLAAAAYINTWKYRGQVRIVWGNFWKADLTPADGVFVFLLDRFMGRLDKKLTSDSRTKSIRLVSYAFRITGRKAAAERGGMFLYLYLTSK